MIHKHKCENADDFTFALQYDQPRAKITIGGDRKIQLKLWRIYVLCFGECDGEPEFYEVTRCRTRLTFSCTFKKYQESLANIADEGFDITDIDAIDRMM